MWHAAEESSKYLDECAFNVHFMEHHLFLLAQHELGQLSLELYVTYCKLLGSSVGGSELWGSAYTTLQIACSSLASRGFG